MTSNWKVLNTKFVQLIKIYNSCFGQLSIWDSLDGSNLWFLNFDAYKLVFGTLDCLKLKSFEYQVCSAHQDIQSLYSTFFHLRNFEQNVVQISQVCDLVWESLRFKNLWLVFDKTFSNGKMSYVTIVDLAEMIKLGIQRFFIWGHLVSHLSSSSRSTILNEKTTLWRAAKISGLQSRPRPGTRTKGWAELPVQKFL